MSRNRKLARIALLAALGLGTATAVVAQPGWTGGRSGPGGGGPVAFSMMDTDGDGYVSADEHATFRAQRMAANARAGRLLRGVGNAPQFTDMDANGDGRLSRNEVAQFRGQRMVGRPCYRRGRSGWGW